MPRPSPPLVLLATLALLVTAASLLFEPRARWRTRRIVDRPITPPPVASVPSVLRPGSMRAVLGGSIVKQEPLGGASSPTDSDKRPGAWLRALLKANPPPESWEPFLSAMTYFEDGGHRVLAARRFEEVARRYPDSPYAADSRELAARLRDMVKEEGRWREPWDVRSLPLVDRIEYYVYHLRDVHGGQLDSPGMCSVLEWSDDNAAARLRDIGQPAIPRLINLLHDRRPIRAVGFWRDFHPSRTVLRYQDVAIEILQELIPERIYARSTTAHYLSTEPDAHREAVIAEAIRWWNHHGRPGAPR